MIVKLGSLISEYSVRNKADEDIPVYSVTNEQGFCTGYFSNEVASQDRTTYKIVPRGCFAYNPSRINVGSVDVQECEDRVIVSPLYVVFSVDEKLNRRYLLHYLKSDITLTYIKAYASGSVRDNLKFSILKDFPINLPSAEEQEQIVATLDGIEHLIALRKEELASLDDLVKSRFIELFGDTPDGEKVAMADICRIITDGTHQPPKFVSEGIPFLFVSNIVTNEIRYDAQKFISEETYAELIKRTPIAIGDILLSTVGSYGHPAVVKTEKPFCFQRHIAYLKPNADIVDSEYLRGAILSADVQRQIDEGVKGIAQKTLNLSEIRKIRLPLPPIELQEQFAAFVEQTDKSKLCGEMEVAA
jgi:type I restriction enzyme S subunit